MNLDQPDTFDLSKELSQIEVNETLLFRVALQSESSQWSFSVMDESRGKDRSVEKGIKQGA